MWCSCSMSSSPVRKSRAPRGHEHSRGRSAWGAVLATVALGVAGVASLSGLAAAAPDPALDALRVSAATDRAAMSTFLDSLGARYERASSMLGESNWALYTKTDGPARETAKAALDAILIDDANHTLVKAWLSRMDNDAAFKRRLTLWNNAMIGADVDLDSRIRGMVDKMSPQLVNFETKVDGRIVDRNEIRQILSGDKDRDRRRKAYEAYIPLAKLQEKNVIQLVRLRNAKAKSLGYPDYPHLVMAQNGLDYDWVMATLDKVRKGTDDIYADWLASATRTFTIDEPYAWDLQFLVQQTTSMPDRYFPSDKAQERLAATTAGMGFDLAKLPIKIATANIPFGGQNIAVQIPNDDRLLVNPAAGARYYDALFHEMGHALEATQCTQTDPILKGYEWALGASEPAFSEGLSETIAEFVHSPDWLKTIGAVPPDEVKRSLPLIKKAEAYQLRSLLVDVFTELELYKNPAGDIGGFERRMRKELLGVDTPQASQSWWAASPFLLDYPIYQQNYIIAAMVGENLQDAMVAKFGSQPWTKLEAGQWLKDTFFAPGLSTTWQEKLQTATGKPLDVDDFVAKFKVMMSN